MTTLASILLAVLSVWDYPARQAEHERLSREFILAARAGDVKTMEASCRKGVELLPDDPTWAYNLACSLAYRAKPDEALDQLEKAIDLGFRNADAIAADADLKRLAANPRFAELVERARKIQTKPILSGPLAAIDATGVMGETLALGEQNFFWDFDDACFVAKMALAPGPAGGNAGDLYMNRDANHSRLAVTNYPGLTEVRLDQAGREKGLDLDFPNVKFPYPVFGNCSRAIVHEPYWRSLPRAMMTTETRALQTSASLYRNNEVWVFPANRDCPPVGTNGDVFASVTPYWIVTQGRSWSDQYYLRAALEASRSFDPLVKREILSRRLLAPTIQALLRKSLKGVANEADYLTEKAHPSCFPPDGLDLARLKRLAAGMRLDEIPPVVAFARLGAPVREKPEHPELTYATPFAAAIVLRSADTNRVFDVSVAGAEEFAFRIVHDPNGAAKILESKGNSVRLVVDRLRLAGTARVDLAAFGRNRGSAWGAPSFFCVSVLDTSAPYYDPALQPRIQVQ